MSTPMFTGTLAWASNFAVEGGPFWVPALGAWAESSEHGFNALKTTSEEEQKKVLNADSPKDSKRIGRRVSLRPGWNEGLRVKAMAHVLKAKFALPHYEENLLESGQLHLVETNFWHDQFWGDCLCSRHANEQGTNKLGELLMNLRTMKRADSNG